MGEITELTPETVESPALSLESVDDVHGGHRLPPGVLSVSDGVTDDVFEKDLEDTSGLFINEPTDTLHSASASQTANGRLRDALNVIPETLTVTLGSSFAQTLASLSTA